MKLNPIWAKRGLRASVVASLVLASAAFVSPAQADEVETCDDQVATIVSSDRVIYGTSGVDVIVVEGEGRHKVLAGKGADVICGSESKDRINGGAGPDTIFGEGNDDFLIGGSGRDMIMAGPGDDQVNGGPARDAINGQEGVDTIDSGIGLNYCAGDLQDVVTGECVIDETAPTIYDVSFPAIVEAGSTAIFSWKSDDALGISYTGAYFGSIYGWVGGWCDGFTSQGVLVDGDSRSGTYQVECVIPQTAVNGTYTIFLLSNDLVGNTTWGSTDNEFEVVSGITDSAYPNLVSLSSPETVGNGELITLNFELTDESGVSSVYAYIAGPDGFIVDLTTGLLWAESIDWYEAPVSGDTFNGVWQLTYRMMEYAPAGTYNIWYGVSDIYGNHSFSTQGPAFEYLG
jgi:hypothetical protein